MKVSISGSSSFRKCLHKYARKYGSRADPINMGIFLPIANYRQFILNQCQEVGQKPAYTVTPKKKPDVFYYNAGSD